jgi:hypothetical protein
VDKEGAMTSRTIALTVLAVIVLLLPGHGADAAAATLRADTNGVDAAGCGTATNPCRSISAALAAAIDGDRIVVGPGRYGDLNGNGVADPGDEASIGPACDCLIRIAKRITLESEQGALTTIIDAGGRSSTTVLIAADGVVLGKPGRGFTVTRAGVGIGFDLGVGDATIAGNHARANQWAGFAIFGRGHRVTRNLATDNGHAGFTVYAASPADGHVLSGNIAVGSELGFEIQGAGAVISGNVASENTYAGFAVHFGPHTFTGNSAVGNQGYGIWSALLYPGTVFTKSNIYGNDPSGNCGLANGTGGAMDAHGNFWGVASGPGPAPADQVCNTGSSTTTTLPVATREFTVNGPKLQ